MLVRGARAATRCPPNRAQISKDPLALSTPGVFRVSWSLGAKARVGELRQLDQVELGDQANLMADLNPETPPLVPAVMHSETG